MGSRTGQICIKSMCGLGRAVYLPIWCAVPARRDVDGILSALYSPWFSMQFRHISMVTTEHSLLDNSENLIEGYEPRAELTGPAGAYSAQGLLCCVISILI